MTLRVLVAVTHLLGAGHLTRATAIARALAHNGHRVTLVSGGRPTHLIPTDGLELVQLPPVHATVDDLRTVRGEDGQPAGPGEMAERRAMLLGALEASRADIVLTELFPFGRRSLEAEFLALIKAAYRLQPRPILACSIRDILVAPGKAAKIARTHQLLARYYDNVLVHSDPSLVSLEASWPVGAGVGAPLVYTGYVDPEPGAPARTEAETDGTTIVSGGSSAAGLLLYRAAIEAARLLPDRSWRILVGTGVDGDDFADLRRAAQGNIVVERARPDFRELLRRSSVFVGQAGYNTVVDLLAAGTRAVLVPFEQGAETEQRLRAERLAERGLAALLPEAELTGPALAASVRSVLSGPKPSSSAVRRDGAQRTAALLRDLAAMSRTSPPRLETASGLGAG